MLPRAPYPQRSGKWGERSNRCGSCTYLSYSDRGIGGGWGARLAHHQLGGEGDRRWHEDCRLSGVHLLRQTSRSVDAHLNQVDQDFHGASRDLPSGIADSGEGWIELGGKVSI